jgi:hypothetical protein
MYEKTGVLSCLPRDPGEKAQPFSNNIEIFFRCKKAMRRMHPASGKARQERLMREM